MNRKALAVAVAAALTAPMAAQAVSTNWYGHVNRGMQIVDDGNDSEVNFVDATAYSTRMGWSGTADAGNGVTAGAKIEYGILSNAAFASSATGINPVDTGNAGNASFTLRHASLYFSGNWGKLTMGHTSDASDGVAYATHNSSWEGTELAHDWGTGVAHRVTGGAAAAGSTAGSVYAFTSSFDGGRRDVLRYDTPSIGPLSAAISAGTNSRFDASLRMAADVGGGSLLARIGYGRGAGSATPDAGAPSETLSGSASYKFSQGTFVDVMYGTRDLNSGVAATPDPDTWYVALGHLWGNNGAVIDYQEGSDVTAGCDGTRVGIGFTHSIPAASATLYTGYHNHAADCDAGVLPAGAGIEDIDIFHVGARVHFD